MPNPRPDIVSIGPECFGYTDGMVVSWKGQEYVKTCGEFVKELVGGGQAFCTLSHDHPGNLHVNTHLEKEEVVETPFGRAYVKTGASRREDSNLVKHARRELELVGEDADVIEWFLETVRAFASYGHSGGSMEATLPILEKLLRFENLTQLTNDPDEWIHHGADVWGEDGGIWQNVRNSKMFSRDGGRSYFNVDNRGEKVEYTFDKDFKPEGYKRPKIERL